MDSPAPSRPYTFLAALRWLIVAGMFIAGALLYNRLPAIVPTHWGLTGEANGFSPKIFGVWLLPGLALAFCILFPLFSRIDPKKENYEAFRPTWELLQLIFVTFFAYIYGMMLYLSLNPLPSPNFVGRFVTFGIGVLFVILGNYMGKIRQNFFIGMRTPWSLSDPEVWTKSQRFGGWAFVLGGLAILAEAVLWWHAEIVFFAIVMMIAILPMVYSFLIYPRDAATNRKAKKSFLLLIALCIIVGAAVAATIRLTASEDDWICSNGQWVQHGHPSIPMPTTPCK
jgi:uncharacterized membrane protein